MSLVQPNVTDISPFFELLYRVMGPKKFQKKFLRFFGVEVEGAKKEYSTCQV